MQPKWCHLCQRIIHLCCVGAWFKGHGRPGFGRLRFSYPFIYLYSLQYISSVFAGSYISSEFAGDPKWIDPRLFTTCLWWKNDCSHSIYTIWGFMYYAFPFHNDILLAIYTKYLDIPISNISTTNRRQSPIPLYHIYMCSEPFTSQYTPASAS